MSMSFEGLNLRGTAQKAKLSRLSVCECGFSTLHDDILLGTEYTVCFNMTDTVTFVCGGCGHQQRLEVVMTLQRESSHGGYLPRALFEPSN